MPGSSGHGAKFWVEQGDGAFYRVGQIQDVGGPSLDTADVDVTTNDSEAHTKEYIASLISGGEVSFPMLLDSGRVDQLRSYQINQSTLHSALLLPSEPNVLVVCDGYVKNMELTTPMEEAITADVGFMVTGPVRMLRQLVGPLTLTPAQGTDRLGDVPPGTNRSSNIGFFKPAANPPADNANDGTFGTLVGEDGSAVDTSDITALYSTPQTIRLRIADYTGPSIDNQLYMLFDTETMRRQGQTGGIETASALDFVYHWGGAIGTAPFTVGEAVNVQLFAA